MPTELGNTALRSVVAYLNFFGGPLPAFFGALANLEEIDLSDNLLTEPFLQTLLQVRRCGHSHFL